MTGLPPGTAVLGKRGAVRLATRHPWIYRSDTLALPETPGFYPVSSRKGRVLGWGAVNPRSLIAIRMIHDRDVPVTESLLVERLEQALAYRRDLAIPDDGHRLVHAEADGLPALVVDRYAEVLVLQSGSAALEPHLEALVDFLQDRLRPQGILGRLDGAARAQEGLAQEVRILRGDVPPEILCREGAVRYLVDPFHGQKTGAFLDQRLNRRRLGDFSRGRALDVFCYQGGFARHLAPAADDVVCLDASETALHRAARAFDLNGFTNGRFLQGDAFGELRTLVRAGERFDVISLDPPAFAKRHRDVENAYAGYKDLNLLCLKLLAPGGILASSSCSFHLGEETFAGMLRDAAADAGRELRLLERRGAAPDHPERLSFPESRYLKCFLLQALD